MTTGITATGFTPAEVAAMYADLVAEFGTESTEAWEIAEDIADMMENQHGVSIFMADCHVVAELVTS